MNKPLTYVRLSVTSDAYAPLLFDALSGAMLRRATRPAMPGPTHVLDDLLEVWT